MGNNRHKLETASFHHPVHCDVCGKFVKGFTKQGFSCTNASCGMITCKKCKDQAHSNCPLTKEERKEAKDAKVAQNSKAPLF